MLLRFVDAQLNQCVVYARLQVNARLSRQRVNQRRHKMVLYALQQLYPLSHEQYVTTQKR